MRTFLIGLCLGCRMLSAADAPPRSFDPRLTIELFAEQPQLRTPTGIDVDARGRVWVIESNTHFRPENYDGHPSDRLLILTDTDGDGRADDVKTFADGFQFAMSVAARPVWLSPVSSGESPEKALETSKLEGSGLSTLDSGLQQVFLAERSGIWLLEDMDGDDACDRRTKLVTLETEGNYPHNGLAGFAFDALGWMYFGLGENLGAPYKLVSREMAGHVERVELRVERPASDEPAEPKDEKSQPLNSQLSTLNSSLSGGGEGGNIYRMRPDGTQLTHWATGFWNPHASCVDAFGRLFTVDNDADSRPPCRLLHIIEGGDYGFRFRNGRKGLHPFTSWNGEIPGTLPMVAGTGEAPSGILAYEHEAFPEEYLGNLFVTSWGDHRIDRFRLQEKGASFESIAEPLITGGENFRPVGIALAPDGSLYVSDWVLKDYNLHGQGRVWRVRVVAGATTSPNARAGITSASLGIRRTAARQLATTIEGRRELLRLQAQPESSARARMEAFYSLIDCADIQPAPNDLIDSMETIRGEGIKVRDLDEVFLSVAWLTDNSRTPHDKLYRHVTNFVVEVLKVEENRRIVRTPRDENGNAVSYAPKRPTDHQVDAWLERSSASRLPDFVRFDKTDKEPSPMRLSEFVRTWSRIEEPADYIRWWTDSNLPTNPRSSLDREAILLAARRRAPRLAELASMTLCDSSPSVRRLAVQWAAEEKLTDLRPQVEAVLKSEPMTTDLFLATLAALEMLDGKDPKDFDQTPPGKYVFPLLSDPAAPPAVKAQALRLVDPADTGLTLDLLKTLLASDDPALRLEAVRSLAMSPTPAALDPLLAIAQDAEQSPDLRYAAIAGLTERDPNRTTSALFDLLAEKNPEVQIEALRALRTTVSQSPVNRDGLLARHAELLANSVGDRSAVEHKLGAALQQAIGGDPRDWPVVLRRSAMQPTTDDEWRATVLASEPRPSGSDGVNARSPSGASSPADVAPKAGASRGVGSEETLPFGRGSDDAAAGERVFFHPNGPRCYQCHTVNGRGGRIGPDLSRVGAALSREKLLDSILNPSKEVAPQFTTWNCVTNAGVVHTGMIVFENKGETTLGSSDGKLVTIPTIDIDTRTPQPVSVMPEKLEDRLTVVEFRDLLEFLGSLK